MVRYVWILMCAHPESDSYWIEAASLSEDWIKKVEQNLIDKSDGLMSTKITKVQLGGEILR